MSISGLLTHHPGQDFRTTHPHSSVGVCDRLPAEIKHVVSMIDVFVRLAGTAVKLKEGKDAGGVLDLAMQLPAAIKAKEGGTASGLTQKRISFESDFKHV